MVNRCPHPVIIPGSTAAAPNRGSSMLEEMSDDAGGGWRVCCYNCHLDTETVPTRGEALEAWVDGYMTPWPAKDLGLPDDDGPQTR